MTTLTVNQALLAVLQKASEPAEIRDESGKVVGMFVPADKSIRRKERTPEEEVAYWAEIERRAADPKPGVPLREVYKRLLTLTDDEELKADLRNKIDILTERDRCCSA